MRTIAVNQWDREFLSAARDRVVARSRVLDEATIEAAIVSAWESFGVDSRAEQPSYRRLLSRFVKAALENL